MTSQKKQRRRWKLLFAKTELASVSNLEEHSIALFLKKTSDGKIDPVICRMYVKGKEISIEGELFLSSLNPEKGIEAIFDSALKSLFDNTFGQLRPSEKFFSMLSSLQTYRDLVGSLGVQEAREVLTALHDIIAAKTRKPRPEWARAALASSQFRFEFIKSSSSFFTFHNAGSILRGLAQETGELSPTLQIKFQIATFSNPHVLTFKFDRRSLLPKRIAVMIGENGVGKSRALNRIANSVLQDDGLLSDSTGNRPQLNRVIAMGTPGETRRTFPPDRGGMADYRRVELRRGVDGDVGGGLADALVRLARSPESVRGMNRWELFEEAVAVALEGQPLSLRTHRDSRAKRAEVDFTELREAASMGDAQITGAINGSRDPGVRAKGRLYPLSSGQLTFLRFAAYACLHIENGSLVLMDEPETHLHPNFIARFVELLDKVLELTASSAIIATHSPYLVREVPQSQVLVLRRQEGKIGVENPRLRTFGASISSISHFVFGDDTTARLVEKVRSRLPADPRDRRRIISQLRDELSDVAVMELEGKEDGG